LHEERVALVLSGLPADATLIGLADTFRLLGDPTRVRILSALAASELCVCDLAALLGVTSSAVSHQLRLLRTARLVRYRKEGKMVYYALDDEHIRTLLAEGLRHVTEG
jgi:DNA-binding transcriptional ArsR family regulator